MSEQARSPTFLDGFTAFFGGFRSILDQPSLWPWAAVPTLLFLALEGGFIALALLVVAPWVTTLLPEVASWYGEVAVGVVTYGSSLLVAVLGWFLAAMLAAPLSAPALEHIVERVERELGAPERVKLGWLRELACGFRALLGGLVLAGPLLLLVWVLEVTLPVLAPITLPAHVIVSSLLIAWGLFDYPLTLRGIGFRERLRLVRANFPCVLGFGLAFALVFWFPCCGVMLLPVGAAAATRLTLAILP
ncbi:MAG TPA: EI24 domain-containing protein [Polyangiaceae bacterium]